MAHKGYSILLYTILLINMILVKRMNYGRRNKEEEEEIVINISWLCIIFCCSLTMMTTGVIYFQEIFQNNEGRLFIMNSTSSMNWSMPYTYETIIISTKQTTMTAMADEYQSNSCNINMPAWNETEFGNEIWRCFRIIHKCNSAIYS